MFQSICLRMMAKNIALGTQANACNIAPHPGLVEFGTMSRKVNRGVAPTPFVVCRSRSDHRFYRVIDLAFR